MSTKNVEKRILAESVGAAMVGTPNKANLGATTTIEAAVAYVDATLQPQVAANTAECGATDLYIPMNIHNEWEELGVTGQWDEDYTGHRWELVRGVEAVADTLIIDLSEVRSRNAASLGMKLTSIIIAYEISAAVMDAITPTLWKTPLPADAAAATPAAVPVTAALPITVANHTESITIDTPITIDDSSDYNLELAVSNAAGTGITKITKIVSVYSNVI